MKRQIFLIKGYSKNLDELKIDNSYLDYYSIYFKSIAGGAYVDDEICILKDPQVDDLKLLISKIKPDFGIVVLIGHGANQDDFQLFQINESEIIRAGQMQLDIKKQLIILESCRVEVENVPTVDLNGKVPNYKKGGKFRIPINSEQAKRKYIEKVNECKDGIVVCFACSKGESAWNFYFSTCLIQTALNWCSDNFNNQEVLPITKLMHLISHSFPKLINGKVSVIQNPEFSGEVDYPFAISRYKN